MTDAKLALQVAEAIAEMYSVKVASDGQSADFVLDLPAVARGVEKALGQVRAETLERVIEIEDSYLERSRVGSIVRSLIRDAIRSDFIMRAGGKVDEDGI